MSGNLQNVKDLGNFLESNFWTPPPPPPPPYYQFCTWILNVRHVAAALGTESVLT